MSDVDHLAEVDAAIAQLGVARVHVTDATAAAEEWLRRNIDDEADDIAAVAADADAAARALAAELKRAGDQMAAEVAAAAPANARRRLRRIIEGGR